MASLFSYIKEIDDLFLEATDEDGVIDFDQIKDRLEELELGKAEKIDNCLAFCKSRTATADALKKEKAAIADRQRVAENEAKRMKEYIGFCLRGEKYESTAGKVSYRKSESVEITNEDIIPDEYLKWESRPNKTAMKDDLKQGVVIDGAHLEVNINTIIK